MAKAKNEEQALLPPDQGTALEQSQGNAIEQSTLGTVTILYSKDRDLYRVPSIEKICWLSVKVHELPVSSPAHNEIYLGPSLTADAGGWRQAYAIAWRAIWPGDLVTLPADDPRVLDYMAFGEQHK
jgi:hypothetical protein